MPKVAKKKNGYQMPSAVPEGTILTDKAKHEWKVGPSIGKGGFGEIYSGESIGGGDKNIPYAIKIEPHVNGPLFVEMHFYMRNCKMDDVEEFKKEKKLKHLGIPIYYGSGHEELSGERHRFIVMEQFGISIWKLFLDHKKSFPTDTVLLLGIQMVNVLEYIHSKGYIHGDIKGSNILLGKRKGTEKNAFLLDYGLAGRISTGDAFKPDPKKAHNGTIEYLSVDAHCGVQTRRGDLEILFYNLIQWLGNTLPWESKLSQVKSVHSQKEEFLKNENDLFSKCFKDNQPPAFISQYLKYLNELEFNTVPDYDKLRDIMIKSLNAAGVKNVDAGLVFLNKSPIKRKSPAKKIPVPKKSKKTVPREDDEVKSPSTKKNDVQNNDEQEPNKLKAGKKKVYAKENGEADDAEVPTAEMLKYRKKLEAKPTKKTTTTHGASGSARVLRTKRDVNYTEGP